MGIVKTFLTAAGCTALLLQSALLGSEQKRVVADFEDFGTWRLREHQGSMPGAWWAGITYLSGSDAAAFNGGYAGELAFRFDPKHSGTYRLGFDRHKMSLVNGFLSGIEFFADRQGHPVSIAFDIIDSTNRTFRTRPVALTGDGWNNYRIEFTEQTLPELDKVRFPARLQRVLMESAEAGEGSIYLDDITLTGRFTRKDQLSLTPIYEGIYYLPQEPVTLRYRARNATAQEQAGGVSLELFDFEGNPLQSKRQPLTVGAWGEAVFEFELGELPIGAYEAVLKLEAGSLSTELDDVFGVFVPNNRRLNTHPMWFGVQDQSSWQGPFETMRHLSWMKVLGVDIDRVGMSSYRLEREPGLAEEGWTRLFNAYKEAGIDMLILYDESVPRWTQTKPEWRAPADKLDLYEEFTTRLGGFLGQFPHIRYVEFWNEPDLEFYRGTFEEYLAMLKLFYKGVGEPNPHIEITSGGVTIKHPREKPGFSRDMYQKAADYYDVAAYHSHGPLNNNVERQIMLENWLSEAGITKRYVNTEAGDRSLHDAEGRRRQAITLVKKIVYSKSVPGFEAYFWFTLQDYWDMDPTADDSFGLVTSDNRAKPSFVAYNALIAQLANTTPEPSKTIDAEGLVLYTFRKDDGRYVYAGWPSSTRSNGILWIKTDQAVEVTDMFGAKRTYEPLGSVVPVAIGDQPIYIAGAEPGKLIEICAEEDIFLQMDTEVILTGAGQTAMPVLLRNPTAGTLAGELILKDDKSQVVARKDFSIGAGKTFQWEPQLNGNLTGGYDSLTYQLELAFAAQEQPSYVFPVQFIGSYPVQRVAALGKDPARWPAISGNVPAIVIDRPEDVVELTYDPTIRAWRGAEDLSASAQMVHDGKGVRVRIEVTDDVQSPVQDVSRLWLGDDVQLAIGAPDNDQFAILDMGLTADGPGVWCSQHATPSLTGQWDIPLTITRQGTRTIYDAYIPLEKLGLAPSAQPQPIRWTFMVNENDGQGRVRWIQWKDGIGRNRSLDALGYGVLE